MYEEQNEITTTGTRDKVHVLTNAELTKVYAFRTSESAAWDDANAQMAKVGYYEIRVNGNGNYTGSAVLAYRVQPVEFIAANISIVIEHKTYTSKTIALTADDIVVTDLLNNQVIPFADLVLDYGNYDWQNAGTTYVSISVRSGAFDGGYDSQSITCECTIDPRSMSDYAEWFNFDVDNITRIYNREAYDETNTPITTRYYRNENVQADEIVLVLGTDFLAAYSDNINAGIATITIQGIGNFTGTWTLVHFTITAKQLDNSDVDPSDTDNLVTETSVQAEIVYDGQNN